MLYIDGVSCNLRLFNLNFMSVNYTKSLYTFDLKNSNKIALKCYNLTFI